MAGLSTILGKLSILLTTFFIWQALVIKNQYELFMSLNYISV